MWIQHGAQCALNMVLLMNMEIVTQDRISTSSLFCQFASSIKNMSMISLTRSIFVLVMLLYPSICEMEILNWEALDETQLYAT